MDHYQKHVQHIIFYDKPELIMTCLGMMAPGHYLPYIFETHMFQI